MHTSSMRRLAWVTLCLCQWRFSSFTSQNSFSGKWATWDLWISCMIGADGIWWVVLLLMLLILLLLLLEWHVYVLFRKKHKAKLGPMSHCISIYIIHVCLVSNIINQLLYIYATLHLHLLDFLSLNLVLIIFLSLTYHTNKI